MLTLDLYKKRLYSIEVAQDILQFGNYAAQIYDLGNRNKIEKILNGNWNMYEPKEVLAAVKPILYSIFPYRKYNVSYVKNHFWISYSFVKFHSFSSDDIKPNFFVIYANNEQYNMDFIKLLTSSNTRRACNTILLIALNTKILKIIGKRIIDYLEKNKIDDHYQLVCFTKEDLQELYNSKDKTLWIDDFFRKQIELIV